MRIVQVALGYLPAVGWGGPVRVVHQVSHALARRGHHVTICASNLLGKGRRMSTGTLVRREDDVDVVHLDTHSIGRWPGTVGPTRLNRQAAVQLREIVRAADVVHIHGTRSGVVWVAGQAARKYGVPYVLQPHGTLPQIVSSIRLKRLVDPFTVTPLVRGAGHCLALTAPEEQELMRLVADPSRVSRIGNGMQPAQTNGKALSFRADHGVRPDSIMVLFLGRVNPKKGADLLVQAFAGVPSEVRSRAQLVIAGPDDGHLGYVRELVASAGIQNDVVFTGELDADQATAAVSAADVFALTCRVDTYPMVLLEAAFAGTAILLADTCEIADLFAGAAQIVPLDIPRISDGLAALLADAPLRVSLAARAEQLARDQFTIDRVADRLEAVYSQVRKP